MTVTLTVFTVADLRAYAEGTLDAEDRADMESLLADDPRAAQMVETFRREGAAGRPVNGHHPRRRTLH